MNILINSIMCNFISFYTPSWTIVITLTTCKNWYKTEMDRNTNKLCDTISKMKI